jgi:hypothetical protein
MIITEMHVFEQCEIFHKTRQIIWSRSICKTMLQLHIQTLCRTKKEEPQAMNYNSYHLIV